MINDISFILCIGWHCSPIHSEHSLAQPPQVALKNIQLIHEHSSRKPPETHPKPTKTALKPPDHNIFLQFWWFGVVFDH